MRRQAMISTFIKISSILLFATTAFANELYITQSGDDFTLDVDQRSENNYISATVTGNTNTVTIRQGMHDDGTIDLDETGGHEAYWTVTGQGNNVASYQTDTNRSGGGGAAHHLANIVNGDSNSVTHTQMGKAGHDGFVEIQGDSNNVSLLQRGNTGQHTADIVLYGDGHSISSEQKDNGAKSLTLDLTNNGGSYTVSSGQYGADAQSYSLTGSCANTIGCSVSVTQQ